MSGKRLGLIVGFWAPLALLITSCESTSVNGGTTPDGIHLEDTTATSGTPPFATCAQMQDYFNRKYAETGTKTTFAGFANSDLMKKSIDYNANAINAGKKTIGDSVLACSGGVVTSSTNEYIKKCTDSNIFYYTFVDGKTFLAWSELGSVQAPAAGEWMNIGSLDSDISRGKCSFSW